VYLATNLRLDERGSFPGRVNIFVFNSSILAFRPHLISGRIFFTVCEEISVGSGNEWHMSIEHRRKE
jgi:hypothetical protein